MTLKEFDKQAQQVLGPLLEKLGFAFERGVYYRHTPAGVRHAVVFDFDVREKHSFRVMVGLNHELLTPERSPAAAGIFATRYLSNAGLQKTPVTFVAQDPATAKRSLMLVGALIEKFALPWFESIRETREAAVNAEDSYPFVKGKLFALAGCSQEAEIFLRKHLQYLAGRPQSDAVVQGVKETRALLDKISTAPT